MSVGGLSRGGVGEKEEAEEDVGEEEEVEEEEKEKGGKKEQSQKRYMVSGSLCPLISFLDVSFSVSFVVRGQRPRRGR